MTTRTRTRALSTPPTSAIDCFTGTSKKSRAEVTMRTGADPESRPGFMGKVARVETGPDYRAWAWTGVGYVDLGVFSHAGTAIEALQARFKKA